MSGAELCVLAQFIGGLWKGALSPLHSCDKVEQVDGGDHPEHHLLQTGRAVC